MLSQTSPAFAPDGDLQMRDLAALAIGDRNAESKTKKPMATAIEQPVVHIEVRLAARSTLRFPVVRDHLERSLRRQNRALVANTQLDLDRSDSVFREIEAARVCESASGDEVIPLDGIQLKIHVYQLNEDPAVEEVEEGEGEEVQTNSHLVLPSRELEGLWDKCIDGQDLARRQG